MASINKIIKSSFIIWKHDNEGDLQSYVSTTCCKKMIDQIICENVGESDLLCKSTKYGAGTASLFQMMLFSLGCSCRFSEGIAPVKQ